MSWLIMKKNVREWAEALLQALIIVGIMFFLMWPSEIDGISMENTFSDCDRVVTNKIMTMAGLYDHGDCLVFFIDDGGKRIKIIKRVIGLEGDRIQIDNGSVYVNDSILNESYVKGYTYGDVDLIVPDGSIYFLGDNREKSTDSRVFGPISKNQISGKVILKFYPIKEFKIY